VERLHTSRQHQVNGTNHFDNLSKFCLLLLQAVCVPVFAT